MILENDKDDWERLKQHLYKRRFWYGSALVHLLLVSPVMLSVHAYQEARLENNREHARVFVEEGYREELQHRLSELRAIERLAEQVAKFQDLDQRPPEAPDAPMGETQIEPDQTDQTWDQAEGETGSSVEAQSNLPADALNGRAEAEQPIEPSLSDADLVQAAAETYSRIAELEQQASARELAELLGIEPSEARERLARESSGAQLPDISTAKSPEQRAALLTAYHSESQAALESMLARVKPDGRSAPPLAGEAGDHLRELQARQWLEQNRQNGKFQDLSQIMRSGLDRHSEFVAPGASPAQKQALKASPGSKRRSRQLSDNDAPADRIYLHSWYVMGPFPWDASDGLNKAWPPERTINLDARYLGKGGKLLRWRFYQASDYPYIPPPASEMAVYYAYTELRSDRPRDVWLALGSDDDSKLWVNNQVVWQSNSRGKPWYGRGGYRYLSRMNQDWNLTESYRKVHLKKGINRFLFKLTNRDREYFMSVVMVSDKPGH